MGAKLFGAHTSDQYQEIPVPDAGVLQKPGSDLFIAYCQWEPGSTIFTKGFANQQDAIEFVRAKAQEWREHYKVPEPEGAIN